MISFITCFKDFVGSDHIAQRSALWSWWINGIPVYVPNNESQVETNCNDYDNVLIVNDVDTAKKLGFNNSSPILKDLLFKSMKHIKTPLIALINGDIIIIRGFIKRLKLIIDKYGTDIFMTGTRFNLSLKEEINTQEKYYSLHHEINKDYNRINSADIFITSKEYFYQMAEEMPQLVVGRYGWDNWIHFWSYVNIPKCYNCTDALPILHCDHDHSHIEKQEGKPGRKALSSVHNLTQLRNMQNKYGQTCRINNWPRIEI